MMVYLAKENKTIAIDYREMAPLSADRDMFLDQRAMLIMKRHVLVHSPLVFPALLRVYCMHLSNMALCLYQRY